MLLINWLTSMVTVCFLSCYDCDITLRMKTFCSKYPMEIKVLYKFIPFY